MPIANDTNRRPKDNFGVVIKKITMLVNANIQLDNDNDNRAVTEIA